MSVPIGGLVRWKPQCFINNQLGENILYFKRTDALVTSPTEDKVLEAIDNAFAPVIRPLLATAAQYMGSSLQRLTPTLSNRFTYSVNAGAGTGTAGDVMSTQTCGLITKLTDMGGKKNRGRMYVPFPSEGDSVLGVPSDGIGGYQARLATLAAQLISDVTLLTGQTFAPWLCGYDEVVGLKVFAERGRITDYRRGPGWATQRKRGYYGKTNPAIIT